MHEFKLAKLKKSFPSEPSFRKYFRNVMTKNLPKLEWNKKNIVNAIVTCRKSAGIPMFRTGYGGEDFEFQDKKASMFVCWGGRDGGSKLFTNIPKEEHHELKMRSGDWHRLMVKYRPDLYKKIVKLPVTLS